MLISTRPPRRLAAVLAICIFSVTSSSLANAQRPDLVAGMLDAGVQSEHDFSVDAGSLARQGDFVRYRLLAVNRHGPDTYDARVEVDCAHRTRRQLSSLSDDGKGHLQAFEGETVRHEVPPDTRADTELRLVCGRAPEATRAWDIAATAGAARPTAGASGRPYRIAASPDVVEVGEEARTAFAIVVDSVDHRGSITGYEVQSSTAETAWATRQHVVVDCEHKLRALQPDDVAAGARLTATHVGARSREARELATACAMPQGPRRRWFAGVVVTSDGVVVAPHARTYGCQAISTWAASKRQALQVIADEDDLTLLRLASHGPWPVMPTSTSATQVRHGDVTMMGVSGTAPRVSAAWMEAAGTNADDPGWPQVRTLSRLAISEGVVWNAAGEAIGLAVAAQKDDGHHTFTRMLPASEVRLRLARHGVTWRESDGRPLGAQAAMQLALVTTIPLTCERAP
jgi:hypothetical protein